MSWKVNVAKYFIKQKLSFPFRLLLHFGVKKIPGNNSSKNAINILAINPTRFRGDLEILASHKAFNVYSIEYSWTSRILYLFYPKILRKKHFNLLHKKNKNVVEAQIKCHEFLSLFWPKFLQDKNIQVVLSPGFHYVHDYDYCLIAQRYNIKHVVIHRENFKASLGHQKHTVEELKLFSPFQGERIFVYNEIMSKILVESGFSENKQVVVSGCLRQDEYIKKINKQSVSAKNRRKKNVVLFSFFHAVGLGPLGNEYLDKFKGMWAINNDVGYVRLFKSVHKAIIVLAKAHPDINFIIKMKWDGEWRNKIKQELKELNLCENQLENFLITDSIDASELILDADVVIGFGSTTIAEASIMDVPIIIPNYYEAENDKFNSYVLLKDDFDLFATVNSESALKQKVLECLHEEFKVNQGRKEIYQKYLFDTKGNVIESFVENICGMVG